MHTNPLSVVRDERSIKVNLYCSLVRFLKVFQLQVVPLASAEWLPLWRCSKRQVQHCVCRLVFVCGRLPGGAQRHCKKNVMFMSQRRISEAAGGTCSLKLSSVRAKGRILLHGVAVMLHGLIGEALVGHNPHRE